MHRRRIRLFAVFATLKHSAMRSAPGRLLLHPVTLVTTLDTHTMCVCVCVCVCVYVYHLKFIITFLQYANYAEYLMRASYLFNLNGML